jgi:hypothetical protein
MFKRFGKVLAVVAMAIGLAACGKQVEVPSAAVAKVMTAEGYKPGVVATSKFRLPVCLPGAACTEIVLLNVSDNAMSEKMQLFMPKDKLNMVFDLQATLSLKEDSYDDMFARISPVEVNGDRWIPTKKIYDTYAQQIIRSEAREFLSQYTINDIASNLETVNQELSRRLSESINKRTPFSVRYIGLANLQYPQIIVEAQENAAKRTEMIRQEEAQLELSKTSLQRQLQEQRMQRQIDVEKAEADAQVARIQADAITPKYLSYRGLDVLEKMANSQNKVFVPTSMLDSIAAQIQLAK